MSDILDNALFEFACKGLSPSKGEKKFQHVIDFGCVGHPPDDPVSFLVCWHLDHLVQIQHTFRKTEDLEKFGSLMEHTYFDYGQEFSRIKHMFAKIINTEVLGETGLFYYDGDTTGYDGYPTKLLGHSLLHLVCFFDYTSHVILFIYYNCN
jgi:hypothetical protein